MAAERFCVQLRRPAVVEGVGDHGCEYMTGGRRDPRAHGPQLRGGNVRGIAYVYDPRARSRTTATAEVDLYEIEDAEDSEIVLGLVASTRRGPGPVAAEILADWSKAKSKFVKVYPRDYKKVMEAKKAKEANEREGG